MTTLDFTKGHGTGNDFVLFADPDGEIDLSAEPDRRDLRPALRRRRRRRDARGALDEHRRGRRGARRGSARRVVHGLPQRRRLGRGDVRQRHPGVHARSCIDKGLAELADGRDARRSAPAAGCATCSATSAASQVDLGRWSSTAASRSCARGTCRSRARVSASTSATRTSSSRSRATRSSTAPTSPTSR